MGVALISMLERVANLFATPSASEPFSCQEQKKTSAEADAFVHATWRGALLPVDPIGRAPTASPLLLALTNAAVAGNTPRPPSTCRTAARPTYDNYMIA
jgi:hypothetical protein